MTIREAKEMVILAGRKLLETGLIARTWGNVSCRISESHFVITPSGRDYLSLTPDNIVEVAIADLSYEGNIKPSSEKGIHAEVYKLHPEANFVIHTHQIHASVAGVLLLDSIKVSEEDFPLLGGEVICAAYGLPGTKRLRRNVAEALAISKGKAVIMKNHGALCFGKDHEEAFEAAHELEAACEEFIKERVLKPRCECATETLQHAIDMMQHAADSVRNAADSVRNDADQAQYAAGQGRYATGPIHTEYRSERIKNGFRFYYGDKSFDIVNDSTSINDEIFSEAEIHGEIYKNIANINYIIHAVTPGIIAASSTVGKLLPLLDDFAQIVGTSVANVEIDSRKISSALKKSSAVLIRNNGALCCGASKGDAQAVSMVMEKNCTAHVSAAATGRIKPINRFESFLMRLIYLKKYSKQF